MTYRDRYHQLQTELAALDDLLAIAPEDAVIDRFSIQKRKDRVVLLLENTSNPEQWPFNARVSFNGKPVESGQGINADFGGEAMSSLAKFITSLAASQWSSLGERGVIPNREDYQVVITGTSLGSFSFDIEEVPVQQSTYLEGPTPVEVAIQQAKEIMRASTGESEGLAEAIEETDNRALNDLRSFIRLLSESDAVCSLSAKGDTFSFGSMSQVRTALINLSLDNVIEDEIELAGHFQGYLPKVRRAEFVQSDTLEIFTARVDQSVLDADTINAMLGEAVIVRARRRRVGSSNPRYSILQFRK